MKANRNLYHRNRRLRKKQIALGIKHDARRICKEAECETILNQYNLNDCCHLHNFQYVRRNKVYVPLEELVYC
jgi:hypothetical protein